MFLLGFLWTLVSQPAVLFALAAAGGAAALLFYTSGPQALLKIVMNVKTWAVIAVVMLGLAVVDLKKSNDKLEQQIAHSNEVVISKDDAAKSVAKREKLAVRRQAEKTRIQEALTHAEPEEVYDATLDAIAEVQRGSSADAKPVPERVQHDRPDGVVRP